MNSTRKHLAGSLAGLLALGLGAGAATCAAEDTVRIGVLTPLSVPGDANAGNFIVRGARLAERYVNEELGGIRGGKPIELRIEDDAGTPEKGVAGYRKLVTQDEVSAVLGQYHSSVMLAVQKLADQMGTPIFATQASNQKITANKLATTFRTHAIDPDRARMWIGYIRENGFKRVALLAENTDYGIGLVEQTEMQNEAAGMPFELKTTVFDRTSVDLSAQFLEIKAWKPDLVINAGVVPGALVAVKQAFDVGLFPAVPMLASYDFPIRPEYWETLGEKGTWLLYISYYHPDMKKTAIGDWFAEQYRKEFDESPLYTAFNAFGQVAVIAQALDKAASLSGPDVVAALEDGEFTSWNGMVTFDRGEEHWHQWSPPMMVLQHTSPNQDWQTADIIYPPELKTGEYVKPTM